MYESSIPNLWQFLNDLAIMLLFLYDKYPERLWFVFYDTELKKH